MKRSIQLLKISFLLLILAGSFSSCVKKEFDEPESNNVDPALTVTNTIKSLQDSAVGATPRLITTDVIIKGVVIADDKSGNFYKEIIIQDDSGTYGIAILVDQSNFNTDFPIGRRVFVKCKGLYVGKDSEGNFQLGTLNGNEVGRIPSGLMSQHLVKGKWGIQLTPRVYSLSATNIPSNTLVKFNAVEFANGDYGVPYANAVTLQSGLLTVQDCSGNDIVLYTSGYSNFASALSPIGNGSITGVLKFYNGYELIIRDISDVSMSGIRCDGSNGQLTFISIDSVRTLFASGVTNVPTGRKIRGVVISDYQNGNMNTRNMVVQDSISGIVVRFSSAHSFPVGSAVEINVSGAPLSEFNGLLQIGGSLQTALCTVTGTGTVTPRVATISQILADFFDWESTLVKVVNTTVTNSGGTYGSNFGNSTLNDGSGQTITLYTAAASSFAASAIPAGPVSITGIVGEFSTTSSGFNPQITMRSAADVQ